MRIFSGDGEVGAVVEWRRKFRPVDKHAPVRWEGELEHGVAVPCGRRWWKIQSAKAIRPSTRGRTRDSVGIRLDVSPKVPCGSWAQCCLLRPELPTGGTWRSTRLRSMRCGRVPSRPTGTPGQRIERPRLVTAPSSLDYSPVGLRSLPASFSCSSLGRKRRTYPSIRVWFPAAEIV